MININLPKWDFVKSIFCGTNGEGSFSRVAAAFILILMGVIAIGVHKYNWTLNEVVWTQLGIIFGSLIGKNLWENLKSKPVSPTDKTEQK